MEEGEFKSENNNNNIKRTEQTKERGKRIVKDHFKCSSYLTREFVYK